MRKIPLGHNEFALIDDEDFDFINQWKWCLFKTKRTTTKYAKRGVYVSKGKSKTIFMHRILLGLNDPNILCDHKDHNGLNNQRNNLRPATKSQNCANKKPPKNTTSNYLGVSWHKLSKRWIVHIRSKGVHKHVGLFKNEKDAAIAYNVAAINAHGDFANLNKNL